MSNDIAVTVRGFTGTGPELRRSADGNRPWTQFRLASTPSLRDADGNWRDGATTWVTVKAFGPLAENVCRSVRKPDPVIVTGRLRTEVWKDSEGTERSTLTLLADAVGHDLTFGDARFARVSRASTEPSRSGDDANGDAGDGAQEGGAEEVGAEMETDQDVDRSVRADFAGAGV